MAVFTRLELIAEVIRPLYNIGDMNDACYGDLVSRLGYIPESVALILTQHYGVRTKYLGNNEDEIPMFDVLNSALKLALNHKHPNTSKQSLRDYVLKQRKTTGCKSIW